MKAAADLFWSQKRCLCSIKSKVSLAWNERPQFLSSRPSNFEDSVGGRVDQLPPPSSTNCWLNGIQLNELL